MNESNLNPETQPPVPQDNEPDVAQNKEEIQRTISRRDFIKMGATGAAGLLLSKSLGSLPPESTDAASTEKSSVSTIAPETVKPTEKFLLPEIVHGVEVYGLAERITSPDQINKIYENLDGKFSFEHHTKIGNKVEQRRKFLNPDERYLEVEVRRLAYDIFSLRKEETQVDFVEWIKMHVDTMNRCMENSKPPCHMKGVLRRIIVVDEELPKSFWDEKAYREGKGAALDWQWKEKFTEKCPLDTDAFWAIADDYRADTTKRFEQDNFWSVRHKNGKTVFGYPPGAENFNKVYEYPEKADSLKGKEGVWLDMGIVHEWSHRLLDLVDEYGQDFHKKRDSFALYENFYFKTGYFLEPSFSPYLSYLMARNIGERARDFQHDNRTSYIECHPQVSKLTVKGMSENPRIEMRKVRFIDEKPFGDKEFPDKPDQVGENGFTLHTDLFKRAKENGLDTNLWSCRVSSPDQATREIFIPAAAFAMSKIAGKYEAEYELEFTGYEDLNKKTQIVKLVDGSDLGQFLQEARNNHDNPYAKMKADGTNTWLVWFLRD
jgi:hypothetical protein